MAAFAGFMLSQYGRFKRKEAFFLPQNGRYERPALFCDYLYAGRWHGVLFNASLYGFYRMGIHGAAGSVRKGKLTVGKERRQNRHGGFLRCHPLLGRNDETICGECGGCDSMYV